MTATFFRRFQISARMLVVVTLVIGIGLIPVKLWWNDLQLQHAVAREIELHGGDVAYSAHDHNPLMRKLFGRERVRQSGVVRPAPDSSFSE